jgi:outer membrane protein assembly factor BamB
MRRWGLALFALAFASCRSPTEVTLALSTDVPCSQLVDVSISVGTPDDVGSKAPSAVSSKCTAGDLGTLVVAPSGNKSSAIGIQVVAGVGRASASCATIHDGSGCIVARRSLNFVPEKPLTLDIALKEACNGVVCPAADTCVDGACVPSAVNDPGSCAGAPCGESSLGKPGAPAPPSPLVCGDTGGLEPGAAWPTMGACSTHVGRGAAVGPQTNTLRWKAAIGGGVETGVALGADGTAYVGASDEKLYAIDPTGAIEWSVKTGPFGHGVPAVATDGTIYVGTSDGNLHAVTPQGTSRWQAALAGNLSPSPAVAADGTIYVAGAGDGGVELAALGADGTTHWTFASKGSTGASPAIGQDGTIYFGSNDNNLYALNPDGTTKWIYSVKEEASTVTVGQDGVAYFIGKPSVCAVDPAGNLLWVQKTNDDTCVNALAADGTLYTATYIDKGDAGTASQLLAYDLQGNPKWKASLGGGVYGSSQPVVGADGTVYVGAVDGVMYAYDASGNPKWTLRTGGAIVAPAALGADGALYFGSEDGSLYVVSP